jgi:iron(III) transport system ATP-binding protein
MSAPVASAAVVFRDVTKRYGDVVAVDDVSLTVDDGTLVTLLGPSGCGKTTTLRMIAGLEQASAGTILIGGADVTPRSAAERDVSMVFQSYALFPHMSVLENVCYGLRAGGVAKPRARERAAATLRRVGLAGYEARMPGELSGGQQQRVAVARAIVLEPRVLLFDEPLSNLDAKLRRRVRDDIRALQQDLGLTVVYVTHDQEEALAVSDRVIVMSQARIAQQGTPRELYEAPASRFVADFIGDSNLIAARVEHVSGDLALVRVGSIGIALPRRGMAEGEAALAVRPRSIRLTPGAIRPGELRGMVRKAAYLGSHMEYEVEVDGLSDPLFVINASVAAPLAPLSDVSVGFAPGGLALVDL